MSCKTAGDWMHDELDGVLSETDARRLADHVSRCAECGVLYEQFDALDAGLDELRRQSVLTDVAAAPTHVAHSLGRAIGPLRIAAAVAVVIGAAWMAQTLVHDDPGQREVVDAVRVQPIQYRGPRVVLSPKSAERYLPIVQPTGEPDVYIVWLHKAITAKTNDDSGSSHRDGGLEEDKDRALVIVDHSPRPLT